MIVEQFGVEDWMDRYEEGARYNITDTCAKPLTLNEFLPFPGKISRISWKPFSKGSRPMVPSGATGD